MEETTHLFRSPIILTGLSLIEETLTSGSQPLIATKPIFNLLAIAIRELQTVKESDGEAFPHAALNFSNELENTLKNVEPKKFTDVAGLRLLSILYYFLLEREFQLKIQSNAAREIQRNLDKLQNGERESLIRIYQCVGADIIRYYLNHSDFRTIREILELNATAKKEREEWNENFNKQTEAIEENRKYLENMRINSGFVALKFGFQRLLDSKSKDAEKSLQYLILFGAALLVVPCLEFLYFMSKGFKFTEAAPLVAIILPALTIQIILIYFFRIVLITHKSLRAQQLQIDLRVAICQFFESYAEFVSKNDNLQKSISKFESMMFSGIVATESAIPSVFDGTEQIVKLVDALKKTT